METFLHSVSSVAIILLMTACGYLCAARGWMNDNSKQFITKLLMRLCIPCMIVNSFQTSFTRDSLAGALGVVLVCILLNVLLFVIAYFAGKALKLPRRSLGVFMSMCALSNAMFVGYPMCRELFGPDCTQYVMFYYLAATTSVQIGESSVIRWSAGSGKVLSKDTLIGLVKTPTIVTIFIAMFLVVFNVKVPAMLLSTMNYMSSCVTPLALVMTGYIIHSIGFKNLKMDKPMAVVLLFRFIVAPAIAIAVFKAMGLEGLMLSVMAVESAMPVVSQTVVFATEYNADEELAARGAAISTIGCFIEIPLLMLLLNYIG